jgi:CheY-like chemotaxis protein
MKGIKRFMIIDDDPHNNMLCRFVIGTVTKEIEIMDFTFSQKGLDYIQEFYGNIESDCQTILFLDINMPVMSGWDFLEKYAELSEHIKNQITIYILSSSVDWSDKEKAATNPFVKDYVIKPLPKGTVENILSRLV